MMRQPRFHDDKYLAWVRTLPCIVTGNNVEVEAAHIRYSDSRIAKDNPGSHKPHDYFVVPLCGEQHRLQHSMNERRYWERVGIDPIVYALMLYVVFVTGADYEQGCRVVAGAGRPLLRNVMAAG